jgi:hypothetical protein
VPILLDNLSKTYGKLYIWSDSDPFTKEQVQPPYKRFKLNFFEKWKRKLHLDL